MGKSEGKTEIAYPTPEMAAYIWRFEPNVVETVPPQSASVFPASIAVSKDLKKCGWKFDGPM